MQDTQPRWRDPERVFLGTGIAQEGPFWAFYLGAIVWWTVDLGFGPLKLVLLGSVLEGTLLLAEVPTGVVADRYSRKWSVIISYAVMGTAIVLSAATLNYGIMLASQALFGIGYTFRSGAEVAWLTDEVAARDGGKPDVSAMIVRRHKLGMLAGVLVIIPSIFVGQWSPRALIILSGCAILVVGIYATFAMTDHFRQGQPEGELYAMKILKSGLAHARGNRSIKLLLLVMLLVGLGAEVLDRLGFKRFLDDGDFGDNSILWTAVLFMILGLLAAGVVAVSEKALERGDSLPLVGMTLLGVAAIGAFITALAPAIGIAIGMAMQDPCRAALDPVSMAWANAHAPDESRATVISLVSQSHGLGELVGGVALASLAEVVGIRPVILVAGVLWTAAAMLARLGATHQQ